MLVLQMNLLRLLAFHGAGSKAANEQVYPAPLHALNLFTSWFLLCYVIAWLADEAAKAPGSPGGREQGGE